MFPDPDRATCTAVARSSGAASLSTYPAAPAVRAALTVSPSSRSLRRITGIWGHLERISRRSLMPSPCCAPMSTRATSWGCCLRISVASSSPPAGVTSAPARHAASSIANARLPRPSSATTRTFTVGLLIWGRPSGKASAQRRSAGVAARSGSREDAAPGADDLGSRVVRGGRWRPRDRDCSVGLLIVLVRGEEHSLRSVRDHGLTHLGSCRGGSPDPYIAPGDAFATKPGGNLATISRQAPMAWRAAASVLLGPSERSARRGPHCEPHPGVRAVSLAGDFQDPAGSKAHRPISGHRPANEDTTGKSGLTGPSYDGLGVTADIQNERRAH